MQPHRKDGEGRRYHVTVLSNFARAYDRYSRRYSKENLKRSTFPDRFFLLRRDELQTGVNKASKLLEKLALRGNRLIVLETKVEEKELLPNLRTGLGHYVPRPWIRLTGTYGIDEEGRISSEPVEELMAQSLALSLSGSPSFDELRPRSISILPIARGCQAACPFCFSHASISADQEQARPDWRRIESVLDTAVRRGAERAVITGGGEPGLLRHEDLLRMIRQCRERFAKVVLISNGYQWARREEADRATCLQELQAAGLTVLALSRHHHNKEQNARLMSLETQSDALAATWKRNRDQFDTLSLRWICVLQKGGIATVQDVGKYLRWAAETGVQEVCFKELYVSTSVESIYHNYASNDWSHQHQVPLRVVLEYAEQARWPQTGELPWGSPLFEGHVQGSVQGNTQGQRLRIAAYTEPSLLWELASGTCRSWNLMSDGSCFASLESRQSEVCRP